MSDDELLVEDLDDSVEFTQAKTELIKRCVAAGIKVVEDNSLGGQLTISFPSGRKEYDLYIVDPQEAKALLSIPFEDFRILGEYAGVYSYSKNIIEVAIESLGPGMVLNTFIRRFMGYLKGTEGEDPIIQPLIVSDGKMSIRLGAPSAEFKVFQAVSMRWNSPLTLTIMNSGAGTHDKTLSMLERIANSFLFQIELNAGFSLSIQRELRFRGPIPSLNRKDARKNIVFPRREYEAQPMSLYWYAKSATGMPLQQFLAYYQVLEFFMPTCSNQEAIGRVKNIIKDPRFNPDTDSQVARILVSLRASGRGFGDERSQLEAVIRRFVLPSDLRGFYTGHPGRVKFYDDGYKSIATQKIPIKNEAADLITETALRLYEIRCRIVHSKDSSDRDLPSLLPYSKESAELHYDIALIKLIATSTLIASSMPLKTGE